MVGALTSPLTTAATLAVGVPVVAAAVWTIARPPGRPTDVPPRNTIRRSAFAWALFVVVAGAWELVVWLQQPAYNIAVPDHPTISVLLDPVTESQPGRVVAWAVWLALGWRLVRR